LEFGEPPPKALTMAWRTEKWGAPVAGGWREWPAGMILNMSTALNVYHAWQMIQKGRWKDADRHDPTLYKRMVALKNEMQPFLATHPKYLEKMREMSRKMIAGR